MCLKHLFRLFTPTHIPYTCAHPYMPSSHAGRLHERATIATTSQVTTTPDFEACHIFWPFRPRASSSEFRAVGRRQALLEGRGTESRRGWRLPVYPWGDERDRRREVSGCLTWSHQSSRPKNATRPLKLEALSSRRLSSVVWGLFPQVMQKEATVSYEKKGCLSRSKWQVETGKREGVSASPMLVQFLTWDDT